MVHPPTVRVTALAISTVTRERVDMITLPAATERDLCQSYRFAPHAVSRCWVSIRIRSR
jgi:ABC-type proline/glycine betaine transport system permease subunit